MGRVKYLTSWKLEAGSWKQAGSCELGRQAESELEAGQAVSCKSRAVSHKLESQMLDKLEILKI